MQDNLYLSADAMPKLMAGVKKVATAVGMTLGTSGKNSLIECLERPNQYATNDGATILGAIRLADPIEEIGRRILAEAVSRANKVSGDGSSTTAVLCAAILEEGMKHLSEASPMEIMRSLEACIPLIEKSIKEQTKEITVDSVAAVASISAEDEKIGAMIQEIYQKIGKEGVIQWDISKTPEDSYTIGTGITINDAKYASRYMCDIDPQRGLTNSISLKNPKILLTKQKITSTTDIDKLGQELYNQDIKELIIFCDEADAIVINQFVEIRAKTGIRVIIVKMPVLWNDEWWEDLQLATGAALIGPTGFRLKNASVEQLGTVEHITITGEDTFLDGIQDLSKHVLALKVDGSDQALQRAERLNTKTARYFVGAQSESALAYKRLKVEDAINAASCALEHGVVPGGGIALMKAVFDLSMKTIGEEILGVALQKPTRQIVSNAGQEFPQMSFDNVSMPKGFDSKTGKIVDMFEAGIVDASDVTLNAVRNAIGVAAAILTVGTVVILPREEWKPQEPNQQQQ